uniref:BLTX170 n=1 Tax=Nephila pilipes TaxID=299642 RepID=A0A076L1X2_NEPPI|nr:BLTX170 [Nephila pilipes]
MNYLLKTVIELWDINFAVCAEFFHLEALHNPEVLQF